MSKISLRENNLPNSTGPDRWNIGIQPDGNLYRRGETGPAILIGGGGATLGGPNYVFVDGSGTPEENGLDLVEKYNEAKTMLPSADNRITVLIAPGHYKLNETLVLDDDFVDLVSLTGQRDVILDLDAELNFFTGDVDFEDILGAPGAPVINVENDPFIINDFSTFDVVINSVISIESDCKIVGIKGKSYISETTFTLFTLQGLEPGIEDYVNALNMEYKLPISQVDGVSPTVINCDGGTIGFGFDPTENTTINGLYLDTEFGPNTMLGCVVNATMINCIGYLSLVNVIEFNGYYKDVNLTAIGFEADELNGQFIDCGVGDPLAAGDTFGFGFDLNGYFNRCLVQGEGFGDLIKSSAYLRDCEAFGNEPSFGENGIESGAVLEGCIGGERSFVRSGMMMEGTLIRCRKRSGEFTDPTGNGRIILGVDGDYNIINETA